MNPSSVLSSQLSSLLDAAQIYLSDITPSAWAEENRILTTDESGFPGPFRFGKTPYTREIADTFSPHHPAKRIAVMKGGQIGFSKSVIENIIGYIISQNPGNILFLTGQSELTEKAVLKIDRMIDNSGLRHFIRSSVLRKKKNSRSGDTNRGKEFPGGALITGSATNHNFIRQIDARYGLIDDIDAAKKSSKDAGSTIKLIDQRFAAYYHNQKVMWISTPQLKQFSNIEPLFLEGDQRRYFIPCQCCHQHIPIFWEISIEGTDGKEKGGIHWNVDDTGKVIESSVGYVCQLCGGFFTEQRKTEFLLDGLWKPTATPVQPHNYSFHISSLYAPAGMYDWNHYVNDYVAACPPGEPRKEHLYQTFVNLCLGQTYEQEAEELSANSLQRNNIRKYDIGIIPEKLSIADGNGQIVLLTCACDLNGTEDDARLDYEIVAYAENGTTYSIDQGSIGTFIPRENTLRIKQDRERYTYRMGANIGKSVWPEFEKIITQPYYIDELPEAAVSTSPSERSIPNRKKNESGEDGRGRRMPITIVGVDTGYLDKYAWQFIDNTNHRMCYGLKGDPTDKPYKLNADRRTWRTGKERGKLYIVESNIVKDDLADFMRLKWNPGFSETQPAGFMNFPQPSHGKYLYDNYFAHFESEKKELDIEKGTFFWVKKASNVQNHMWDCRCYNLTLRDILVYQYAQATGKKDLTWHEFVTLLLASEKKTK